MDTATMLLGVVFGAIGMGYCLYARKQRAPVPLACGIALMVFPWFVDGAWLTAAVGTALAALPWFIRP